MDDATRMYELQRVDLTWVKVARRLQQVQRQLGESEEVRSARQQVAQTEADMHQWRGKQKDAELESKTLAAKIKETEERLMSGQVRNPKELDALQANLEALRRHRTIVDDHAVEALMQADELAGRLNEQQSILASLEEAWSSGQSELRQEETKLKQNYVLLKRKREALASAMAPALLERYEQMRKRKAGVAIAPVQNGVCGACHVQLPTGIVNGLRSGNGELVLCPSCGRYLIAH
ncbi:MAG TPA: C4-type zinc ribbon domain-containing protein [Caldilineaceae bacterium]|nr:C4-type zinc ribbon domain-containing protein [Caldilineaceae bacterium]